MEEEGRTKRLQTQLSTRQELEIDGVLVTSPGGPKVGQASRHLPIFAIICRLSNLLHSAQILDVMFIRQLSLKLIFLCAKRWCTLLMECSFLPPLLSCRRVCWNEETATPPMNFYINNRLTSSYALQALHIQ